MNAIKTKQLSETELQLDSLLSEFESNRAELITLSIKLKKLGYKITVCNTLRSIAPYDCISFSVSNNIYSHQPHSVFVAGNAKDIALMGELILKLKNTITLTNDLNRKLHVTQYKCFEEIAKVIGNSNAQLELFKVLSNTRVDFKGDLYSAFDWQDTNRGFEFWNLVWQKSR